MGCVSKECEFALIILLYIFNLSLCSVLFWHPQSTPEQEEEGWGFCVSVWRGAAGLVFFFFFFSGTFLCDLQNTISLFENQV